MYNIFFGGGSGGQGGLPPQKKIYGKNRERRKEKERKGVKGRGGNKRKGKKRRKGGRKERMVEGREDLRTLLFVGGPIQCVTAFSQKNEGKKCNVQVVHEENELA